MKVLLLGKNGQLGRELASFLDGVGDVTATDRASIDLSDLGNLREQIRTISPNLIVNAAAYTAVDKAESEPDLAMTVNGLAPGAIAEEAAKIGAAIIHYSTDYVFDGESTIPYVETDRVHPLSEYGKSKLAGEQAVKNSGAAYVILRTSWVYGVRGKNFLLTIARLAKERDELTVVSDQMGCPTSAIAIARATHDLIAQFADSQDFSEALAPKSGLHHFASAGVASWYEFACAIVDRMDWSGDCVKPKIKPIPTGAYPTPAQRPKYSVLCTSKFSETFGIDIPVWQESLAEVMSQMARAL